MFQYRILLILNIISTEVSHYATIIKEKTGHYDAEKKEWKTDDVVANTVAHAILGAVVGE